MQIAIVLYPGVTALDAVGPYEVLHTIPEAELRFVAHEPGPVVTDSGVLVIGATHSFEETPSPDIVLVPGSSTDTTTAMADGRLLAWLRAVHPSTRVTVSVCSGSLVLGAAGLLNGLPATSHWLARASLKQFGAEARRDERIVAAGRILTAAGVSAGIDLALELTELLCGRQRAEIQQLMIEYDPRPPCDSGHPSKADERVFERARSELLAAAMSSRSLASVPKILWSEALRRVRSKAARRRRGRTPKP